jgi:hypothetical protein
MTSRAVLLAVFVLALPAAAPPRPRVLAEEPLNGTLRPGETVLVDDGSCPAGQIKHITGRVKKTRGADTMRSGVIREVACVARPH